ncbi:hypothetical protein ACFT9I_07955 [Streptomyces sp. NPDC057137]|uniref:hypothetical protein n=1 Tax=Streptomyces sp. NPDC057137 TaxID=3346030 RepID=UPI0036260563
MGSLTFLDVAEVDLGKLGAAVSDWQKTVAHLKTLAGDAKSGLLAKSDSARWSGSNAQVTRGFVAKTAKEFTDAHAEADSDPNNFGHKVVLVAGRRPAGAGG